MEGFKTIFKNVHHDRQPSTVYVLRTTTQHTIVHDEGEKMRTAEANHIFFADLWGLSSNTVEHS
jgi:hypothetical protein